MLLKGFEKNVMHEANNFEIISFYKFINVSSPEQLKYKFLNFLEERKFKGTIIIANEGLNGTISCQIGNGERFISFLEKTISQKVETKLHYHISHPFLRLKIKIKNEIIRLGKNKIFPEKITGTYIDANKWDDFISNPEVINIDTRNEYESEIGTFKNSLQSNTKNFTEFPKWFTRNKKLMKNKKIAMFCTGGIRCEKASAYLIKQGFNNVYQLNGGIISYLKKTKNKNKKWTGECFVFDERVAVGDNLAKGNMINVMLVDQLLMRLIRNLLNIEWEFIVQNVRNLHQINKRKGLRKGKNKFF